MIRPTRSSLLSLSLLFLVVTVDEDEDGDEIFSDNNNVSRISANSAIIFPLIAFFFVSLHNVSTAMAEFVVSRVSVMDPPP